MFFLLPPVSTHLCLYTSRRAAAVERGTVGLHFSSRIMMIHNKLIYIRHVRERISNFLEDIHNRDIDSCSNVRNDNSQFND